MEAQGQNARMAARAWIMAVYYTLLRPFILLLPSRWQTLCLDWVHRVRDPVLTRLAAPPKGPDGQFPGAPFPRGPIGGREGAKAELITIIGRGHSGTRAMANTLHASGVYMGNLLNDSGDLLPAESMYQACRIVGRHVEWKGGMEWDFSRLQTMPIPREFRRLVRSYLTPVLNSGSAARGWKLPETTLAYPWIVRMFPESKYIFWIRNPRDCILGEHLTDDLDDFEIKYQRTEDVMLRRAISWKYQYDIVKGTPRPAHWIEVRFEDFILDQEKTLGRLEEFLGMELARIVVRGDPVGRCARSESVSYFDFFAPAMAEYRYPLPGPG